MSSTGFWGSSGQTRVTDLEQRVAALEGGEGATPAGFFAAPNSDTIQPWPTVAPYDPITTLLTWDVWPNGDIDVEAFDEGQWSKGIRLNTPGIYYFSFQTQMYPNIETDEDPPQRYVASLTVGVSYVQQEFTLTPGFSWETKVFQTLGFSDGTSTNVLSVALYAMNASTTLSASSGGGSGFGTLIQRF